MRWNLVKTALILLLVSVVTPAWTGEWKYAVGVAYSSGTQDVIDYHEDAIGVDADFSFPIGASFQPYFELEQGHRIGIDVGPAVFILIDTNFGEDKDYFGLPIGATYGYTFARDRSVAPYIRAGVSYNLATGDFVDSSSPGLFGAIGLEFARQKRVGFGVEAAYDGATIDLTDDFGFALPDEEVEGGLRVGFLVIF